MISNIQQQNFDGVVNKIVFNHETSSLCINNNNMNKNQNITATKTPSEWIIHNPKNHHGNGDNGKTGKGYDFIIPLNTNTTSTTTTATVATNKNHHSSENAKEFVLTKTTGKTTTMRTKFNDISYHQNNNNHSHHHHHHNPSHHHLQDNQVNGDRGNNVGDCTSLLDEISELIENHPNGTESAFNNNNNNINNNNNNGKNKNTIKMITATIGTGTPKTKTVSATATVVFKNTNMDHQYSHPHQHHYHHNNKKRTSSIRNQRYHQTTDHRNAFRFIEDVHNYSKLNHSDDSTNSSSQDDDEDFDEEDIIEDHHPIDNSNDDDDDEGVDHNDENKGSKNSDSIENDVIYIRNKIMEKEEEDKEQQYTSTEGDNPIITSHSQFIHGQSPPDDDEEKITPEHHARRPMNAFLIFCKRHRAIVKEKYKNLENRSITKILGEWWASLNAEEKTSYTNLAKQYKDAFFSANPNFKWYKLPAPPLRTLSTRPSNNNITERPIHHHHHHNNENNIYGITTNNCNETIVFSSNNINDNNNIIIKERSNRNAAIVANALIQYDQQQNEESDEETQDASEMGVFKLADEAQMGGLSSLMENSIQQQHNMNNKNSDVVINNFISNNIPTEDEQQKENTTIISSSSYYNNLPICKDEPFENMKGFAAKITNNNNNSNNLTINGKRKSTDDCNPNGCKKPLIQWFNDSNVSSGEEDILCKKSERSCKGKKYQELMNSGQIITFTKKTKPKSLDSYSNTMLLSPIHNGYLNAQQHQHQHQQQLKHSINNNNCIMQSSTAGNKIKTTIIPDDCYLTTIVEEDINTMNNNNNNSNKSTIPTTAISGFGSTGGCITHENHTKQFDASDFDLEKKIKALPAQSLEEYLTRKRETKKKKKINSKRYKTQQHSNTTTTLTTTKESPPKTIQEAKERIQNQMVGSQKRKARKESITRRDINSMIIIGGDVEHNNMPQILSPIDLWNTNIVIKTEGGDDQEMVHNAVENSKNTIIIKNNNNPINMDKKTEEETSTTTTTTTSDLLILAEVAANHIEDNI